MKPLILSLLSSLLCLSLPAMPTEQELAKAEPLIQELMRDDLNAVRMGKKTREQVGDAAVSLAMEAQTPAEKYLLFTGAFDQYMRGGLFEKADVVLDALHKAIPDWKSSDEFSLIDKSMRNLAIGKGGPVRERYESLKGRQQYAAKLKKAQAQAKAKPSDKKLQFQVAAYHAALDDWPAALDGFLAGSNPACAAAAKLEKGSAAPAQTADSWWSAADVKPDFLSSAIRAHAVDLYKKALDSNSLAGLQKVAAERRVQEYESAAESAATKPEPTSSLPSVGTAKYYGVELVDGSVKENKGILSGFAKGSYAKLKAPFNPQRNTIEVVFEFTPEKKVGNTGIFGCIDKRGFTPFAVLGGQLVSSLSSDGATDDIVAGKPIGTVLALSTESNFLHDPFSNTCHEYS